MTMAPQAAPAPTPAPELAITATWPVPAMSSSPPVRSYAASPKPAPAPAPEPSRTARNYSYSNNSNSSDSVRASSGYNAEPVSDANTHPHTNYHSFAQPTKPSSPTNTAAAAVSSTPMHPIATSPVSAATTPTTTAAAAASSTYTTNTTNTATNTTPPATTITTTHPSRPALSSPSATSAPRPIPSSSSSSKTGRSEYSSADTSLCSSPLQTPAESLRRHPTDLTTAIPEEGDEEETCSESFTNDPVTPVSNRHVAEHTDSHAALSQSAKSHPRSDLQQPPATSHSHAPTTESFSTPTPDLVTPSRENPSTPASKPPLTKRSSSTLSRAMSSIFRRSFHPSEEDAAPASKTHAYSAGTFEPNPATVSGFLGNRGNRRFSVQRSVATTRSNSPPSPGSPIEMANGRKPTADVASSMPTSNDFLENNAKKNRAHTGFSLRQKVNFASNNAKNHRRTRSLERKKNPHPEQLTRQPWAIPPDVGTGMKARRLSLSLPDDFTVDIAELLKEYEYQSKFGRHGKHLGKGATSKVTLMARKGCPGELYAVKEFRSKSSNESLEDYEKKIKSEYSIAKSLHHPNVIETMRLCSNHGRWNHVMEYCSEGDLFSLVSKKYLKEEGRDGDRTCLFKQLCQGVNYLHSHGIAHRDIKLENLLITKDSKLKITDFGVSEVFSGIHPGLREAGGQCGIEMGDVRLCKPAICGSVPYIAPEVLSKTEDYDPRPLDVWSSAIVMIYLIFNANLWEKAEAGLQIPSQKTYNDLVAGWQKSDAKNAVRTEEGKESYPKLPAFEYFVKPIGLRRLLLSMLHPDPKKRITMHEVVTNRWMKNVECCQLESYDDPVKFIDVSKKDCMKSSNGKIFCHNHLPLQSTGHGLPPMPGKPGY
ncbi:kinase-like domain-containing protein [Astrocystis sublimbata]|nr:kinase-like domain-containing protein [Astrocystis sublimbata]